MRLPLHRRSRTVLPALLLAAVVAVTAGCFGSAADLVTADQPVETPRSVDHSSYDALLEEYVNEQ